MATTTSKHSAPGEWKPDAPVPHVEQLAREQLARHINAGYKVIVGTMNPWRTGNVLDQLGSGFIHNGRFVPIFVKQPFRIMQETTFEEWIANTPPWIPGRTPSKAEAQGYRFFEVFTD